MDVETPCRVPVALYVCTSDQGAAELLVAYCQQYAQARDWRAVEVITDHNRQEPLAARTGWKHALSLLADGQVRGVVTYSPDMLNSADSAYDAVRAQLSDRGAFLTCARTLTHPAEPPRRTAGQVARRQALADAAGGYEGCGAEWGTLQ